MRPVPMKDWWICRFFSFPVRGHVCQVACKEWRQCTTWRLYPASWLWQIKSSRGDEDVRYDDLTVVFLCQHTPNTDTVGSQNDARNQIYIYFLLSVSAVQSLLWICLPPPSTFDARVSRSNRISCLQVEALHSTENVFFWREFVLADHWSIGTEKSQRVHSDRLLSRLQWGSACSALVALDYGCTVLWN